MDKGGGGDVHVCVWEGGRRSGILISILALAHVQYVMTTVHNPLKGQQVIIVGKLRGLAYCSISLQNMCLLGECSKALLVKTPIRKQVRNTA